MEMRRLHAQGLGVERKQEPFSIEEKNKLWSDGLLGANSLHNFFGVVSSLQYSRASILPAFTD